MKAVKLIKKIDINVILSTMLLLILGSIMLLTNIEDFNDINYILVMLFFIIGVLKLISFYLSKEYQDKNYKNLIIGIICLWLAMILYTYYSVIIIIFPIFFSLIIFILATLSLIMYFNKKSKKIFILIVIVLFLIGITTIFNSTNNTLFYIKLVGLAIVIVSLSHLYRYKYIFEKIKSKKKKDSL